VPLHVVTCALDCKEDSLRHTLRLALVLFAVAALTAPAAVAAERMWIGFHDDPSFRWVPDRRDRIAASAREGATVMRLLVHWNQTVPRRPADGSDPFDPAYNLNDLDEAIRAAQRSDMEVVLTLVGTPRWANGGKGPNVMPRRVADFGAFCKALASRYSGRFDGYPFVRFWTVWNEPNLALFLKPQFDARGRSVAPRNYARLYAAGYSGIKAGNPRSLVAMGETSARGTDNPEGVRPVHSPGRFVEQLARANPSLKFDAYSHHPYPFTPNLRPGQRVRWPNVTLGSLPTLEANLKNLFKRTSVPIWVTEYGHETRPQDTFGIPYAKQASYVTQSIAIARSYRFVTMFVWFVYQDDPGQPWDSGLYTQTGSAKGSSSARFASAAKPLDARNAVLPVRRGTPTPLVTLHTRRFCVVDEPGTNIAVDWRVTAGGRVVETDHQTAPLQPNCTINVRMSGFTVAAIRSYLATFEVHDIHGNRLTRRVTIRGV
jgi:Cellulase (glycosyl hydrolase family 5)